MPYLVVLIIVLVPVLVGIEFRVFAQHIRTIRKFAKQPNKHLDDSRESFFGRNNLLLIGKLSHQENIQTRSAF